MSDLFIAAQETTSIDSSTYDFFCFPFFALSFPQYNLNPSILLERAPSREHSAFSILSHLWFITFISCSFFFFFVSVLHLFLLSELHTMSVCASKIGQLSDVCLLPLPIVLAFSSSSMSCAFDL